MNGAWYIHDQNGSRKGVWVKITIPSLSNKGSNGWARPAQMRVDTRTIMMLVRTSTVTTAMKNHCAVSMGVNPKYMPSTKESATIGGEKFSRTMLMRAKHHLDKK